MEKVVKDQLRELGKFIEQQPRMALSKLQASLRQGIFTDTDMWVVYQLYSGYYFWTRDWEHWKAAVWKSLNAVKGLQREQQEEMLSNYLFNLHYLPDLSDEELRETSFLYDRFAQTAVQFRHSLIRHQHAKLRIGYIMNEMGHGVLSLFYMQLLTGYDRSSFEVYVYVLNDECQDAVLGQVRQNVKVVRLFEEGKNLHDIAQIIYDDEIDIMFDLEVHASGGHTLRVLCYKPAPVQISGIGYMSTSGTKAIDYFLGDRYLDPPGLHDEDFAEQIIRLPYSHFCYTPSVRVLQVHRKWEPHEQVVFASFNNFTKITDEMIGAWAEILRRVPGSRLLVKNTSRRAYQLNDMRRRLLRAGIPEERLTVEGASCDYFDRYTDIDIVLDTYPYTGGGTTCDALYMGIPVVSRYGRRHGSRFGYSLLMNLGLGELAAPDLRGYIERAVAVAQDRELLTALHERLPQMMRTSPIMNASLYLSEVEHAYRQVFAAWRQRAEREERTGHNG